MIQVGGMDYATTWLAQASVSKAYGSTKKLDTTPGLHSEVNFVHGVLRSASWESVASSKKSSAIRTVEEVRNAMFETETKEWSAIARLPDNGTERCGKPWPRPPRPNNVTLMRVD